jgi:ribonuclease P protein component
MLKRINRLSTKRDITLVFNKGRASHGKGAVVKLRSNNLDKSRFAFVVSTKISKKAVERNRIRRRMREVVRLVFDEIRTGYDVVVIAKAAAKDMNHKTVSADLNQTLRKARLIG